ncbi:hypothetical protein H6A35_06270 [Collinsella tanakaei]|nr:hypothetical protein [Collinsella tanakaei]
MAGYLGSSAKVNSSSLSQMLLSEFMVGIAFILLLMENALQTRVMESFAYLDEIICLLFCFAAGINLMSRNRRSRLSSLEKKKLALSAVLSCVGLAGNIIYRVQPAEYAVAIDLFTCNKFILAYVSMTYLLNRINCRAVYSFCLVVGKWFVAISVICMIVNQFIGIGMSYERRFGIAAFLFLFGHPSNYVAAVVGVFALLLVDYRKNALAITGCILLLIGSMRFKAIAFVAVMIFAMVGFRKLSRLSFGFVITAAVVAVMAASYQLDIYMNQETARGVLLSSSLEVANGAFPFGSGFGTYGSDVTKDAYPAMYTMLGFQSVYGLTSANPSYVADMFYSTIIAQFGWFGLVLFIGILICLILDVTRVARDNKLFFWAAMSIPIYLLIATTSEPAFFSSYSVYLALCLVLVLRTSRMGSTSEREESVSQLRQTNRKVTFQHASR